YLLLGRRAAGYHLEVCLGDHAGIAALYQQPAIDPLVVQILHPLGGPLTALQQPYVGLGSHHLACLGTDAGGNDDLDELALDDGAGGSGVQFAVEGDDAAEGGFAVGGERQIIGLADASVLFGYHGDTAGVGMLDDDAGRLAEALHTLQRRIGIGHVVVGQLLALQLNGGGNAGLGWLRLAVEGCALVRVLTVAHVLRLDELTVEGAGEGRAAFGAEGVPGLVDGAQIIGDHAVVGGGVFEGLQRQVEALGIGEAAFGQICQHAVVVARVDHDGNITVVLGRRTDHGRAANVDVLD